MIKKIHDNCFQDIVLKIYNKSKNKGYFFFNIDQNMGAIKSLATQSCYVPNCAGLYFVFCENEQNENPHLFEILEKKYSIIYFGKAGQNKDGSFVKQGLNGRLNNVISDSKRNLKDVKRAKYWEIILDELKKDEFLVIWIETIENCVLEEESIYDVLKAENISYPLLNKKRGKK